MSFMIKSALIAACKRAPVQKKVEDHGTHSKPSRYSNEPTIGSLSFFIHPITRGVPHSKTQLLWMILL